MKGFWKKAVSIFCAAIMVIGLAAGFQTASAAAKFQDAKLGPLHVKGTKLCDKKVVLYRQNVILIFAVIVRIIQSVRNYGERWWQNEVIEL